MSEATLQNSKNAERLKTFTDGVVAIALTLLVLPLVDSVPEAARQQLTAAVWLHHYHDQLLGFAVSFLVVMAFWLNRHNLFEYVARVSPLLMRLNFAWMFTIIFLQLPSALLWAVPTDRSILALYIGTMLLGSVSLTLMDWLVYRTPELQHAGHPLTRAHLLISLATTLLYLAALTLALLLPGLSYYSLLLLLLTRPLRGLILARENHRP